MRNLLKLPEELPPHPRVFTTGDDIARIRSLKNEKWVQTATKRLLLAADTAYEPVGHLDEDADPEKNGTWIHQCMRQALAYHLTDDEKYYERALNDLRIISEAYLAWPILQGHIRAASYGLAESRFTIKFAGVYDLLAGTALKDADRSLFKEALAHTRDTTNRCQHWTCGNHNTWNLAARLAAGIALGSFGDIEDVLWGWEFEGRSRYGFVHQLRHDLLSDGLHWERTPGYHFYSLMAMAELVCMFQHIGVDLWHTDLPAQMEDDGEDHHRAYGPEGNKSFKAAFDAPFFLSLGDGDLSLVHDSGLENLRGVWIWGPLYELAFQAYGDPKYSWLVSHIEETYQNRPEREFQSLPMSLQSKSGELDFMRLTCWPLPSGHFSIDDDTRISLSGRHEKASTLFPNTGVTVLRNLRGSGAGVHLHWGPHSAGHQSPAALHVDLHAGGKRMTDSPRSGGYEDPTHLTWYRSTIAHNTVTVDGQSMIPYDEQGDSIWRSDSSLKGFTDSELVSFQPGDVFQACRVFNERVYPGVRLDRTVVLTEQYFFDVFRVLSREQHQYDYAMHVLGEPDVPGEPEPAELGDDYGYRHFGDAKRWSGWKDDCSVSWGCTGELAGWLRMPDSAILYTAKDPPDSDEAHSLGGLERLSSRSNLIVRMMGKNVVYLSLWQFYGSKVSVKVDECAPENDIVIRTRSSDGEKVLTVPFEHREVELGA